MLSVSTVTQDNGGALSDSSIPNNTHDTSLPCRRESLFEDGLTFPKSSLSEPQNTSHDSIQDRASQWAEQVLSEQKETEATASENNQIKDANRPSTLRQLCKAASFVAVTIGTSIVGKAIGDLIIGATTFEPTTCALILGCYAATVLLHYYVSQKTSPQEVEQQQVKRENNHFQQLPQHQKKSFNLAV